MKGVLRQTGGGRWDWIPASGDPVERVENTCDAPRNTPIIPAWGGNRLVSYEYANTPQRDVEQHRIAMCLLHVVDSPEDDTDQLRTDLSEWAREWEHELRSQHPSGGLACDTCVVVDSRQPRTLFFNPYEVRDQIPGYETYTHWAIRGGSKPGLKGEAYLDSDQLAVYPGGDTVTFSHETWHMWRGRGHSGKPGNGRGDGTCIMGRSRRGLNALHITQMGLTDRIAEISESATVHLVPIETESADLKHGEHHVAKVEHNGTRLLLSLRKTESQHYCGAKGHEPDTVHIHSPKDGQWWMRETTYLDSTQTETEIDGIRIRNLGGGVIQVLIDGPAPEPQPVEALPIPPGDEPTPEHSGVWHDPRFKHQGFDLTIHDGRLTGYWFGHHPQGPHGSASMGTGNNGKRWLVLNGTDRGGWVEFDVTTVINGEPRPDGRGTIRFDGNTALLRWETKTYGREHYRLERLTPPKENAGLFSFGDHSGISVADYHGETCVYYYGPGMGGQSWYVMSGTRDNLEVMSVSSRHRETHPGSLEVLGTAGFVDGGFRMLGRTHDIDPLL